MNRLTDGTRLVILVVMTAREGHVHPGQDGPELRKIAGLGFLFALGKQTGRQSDPPGQLPDWRGDSR